MKNIYIYLSVASVFFSAEAFAASLGYCRPLTAISAKVDDCDDNSIFSAQAKECETALEKEVTATSGSLKTLLLAQAAGSGQAGKMGQTSQDYGVSTDQLDRLVLLAGTAAQDVSGYEKNLVLPEDIENPDIAGSNPQAYADHAACYGDNMKSLKATEAKMHQVASQLTAARTAAASFGKASSGSQDAQNALLKSNAPSAGGAAPAAPANGSYDPSFSDISGTKKKQN